MHIRAGHVSAGHVNAGRRPRHLIERAAQRLTGVGTLAAPELALSHAGYPAAASDMRVALNIAALEQAGMVVGRKPRTRIAEEFRIIADQVLRTIPAGPAAGTSNLLMVTSARPGEGKSFTSLNLGASIALHGRRPVLIADIDAKQRSITHELGLQNRPGLLDLAAQPSLKPEDVLVRTAIGKLAFLPIGMPQADACGASGEHAIGTVIEWLARRLPNHTVVLDAPPCLSTSDPSTIAPVVGQIVMVVQAEQTQRSEIEAGLDLIKACPHITLLLNKIRLTTNYTFGAYRYSDSYS